jgi:hypothetical protein
MTTFLFLRVTLSPWSPRERSRAASRTFVRPSRSRCRCLLLAQVCPTAIPCRSPQLVCLRNASRLGIDVHGSLDRVKDVSSSAAARATRHLVECVRLAHADDVPLLILPEGTSCHRCDALPGNEPRGSRVGPIEILVLPEIREDLGVPEEQGAFHRLRSAARRGLLLATAASAPRSRRPHVSPWLGTNVLCGALQARDT